MKRRNRIALLALGAIVISALVATFAPLFDSTESGTSAAESGEAPVAANLEISSTADPSGSNAAACGPADGRTYQNDQDGAYVASSIDGGPTRVSSVSVCLHNAGADALAITGADVFGLVSEDYECSANEEDVELDDCGVGPAELQDDVYSQIAIRLGPACGTPPETRFLNMDGIAEGPYPVLGGDPVPIAPGEYRCAQVNNFYETGHVIGDEIYENETDRISFKVRFNAE